MRYAVCTYVCAYFTVFTSSLSPFKRAESLSLKLVILSDPPPPLPHSLLTAQWMLEGRDGYLHASVWGEGATLN